MQDASLHAVTPALLSARSDLAMIAFAIRTPRADDSVAQACIAPSGDVARLLGHALSCRAARGGRLHRPDDAQAERRGADVRRRTAFVGHPAAGSPRFRSRGRGRPDDRIRVSRPRRSGHPIGDRALVRELCAVRRTRFGAARGSSDRGPLSRPSSGQGAGGGCSARAGRVRAANVACRRAYAPSGRLGWAGGGDSLDQEIDLLEGSEPTRGLTAAPGDRVCLSWPTTDRSRCRRSRGGWMYPQHRLIHLCEKGVVVPDVHGAAGRGSSRVFSSRNFLELAVALRLRDMMLPVAAVGAVIHVLEAFEQRLRKESPPTSRSPTVCVRIGRRTSGSSSATARRSTSRSARRTSSRSSSAGFRWISWRETRRRGTARSTRCVSAETRGTAPAGSGLSTAGTAG